MLLATKNINVKVNYQLKHAVSLATASFALLQGICKICCTTSNMIVSNKIKSKIRLLAEKVAKIKSHDQ